MPGKAGNVGIVFLCLIILWLTVAGAVWGKDTVLEIQGESVLQFHINREFNFGILGEYTEVMVGNSKLKLRQAAEAAFYPNGMLIQGFLTEDTSFEYNGEKVILFDEQGNLIWFSS